MLKIILIAAALLMLAAMLYVIYSITLLKAFVSALINDDGRTVSRIHMLRKSKNKE